VQRARAVSDVSPLPDEVFAVAARMLMPDNERTEMLLQLLIQVLQVESRLDRVGNTRWPNLPGESLLLGGF
jgi:hypothetical protein